MKSAATKAGAYNTDMYLNMLNQSAAPIVQRPAPRAERTTQRPTQSLYTKAVSAIKRNGTRDERCGEQGYILMLPDKSKLMLADNYIILGTPPVVMITTPSTTRVNITYDMKAGFDQMQNSQQHWAALSNLLNAAQGCDIQAMENALAPFKREPTAADQQRLDDALRSMSR